MKYVVVTITTILNPTISLFSTSHENAPTASKNDSNNKNMSGSNIYYISHIYQMAPWRLDS